MKLKVGIFLLLFIIAQVFATPDTESNVLSITPVLGREVFKCYVKCQNLKKVFNLDTTTLSQKEKSLLKKASKNICASADAKKCSCKNVLNYVDVYTKSPTIERRIKFLKSKRYCPKFVSPVIKAFKSYAKQNKNA